MILKSIKMNGRLENIAALVVSVFKIVYVFLAYPDDECIINA